MLIALQPLPQTRIMLESGSTTCSLLLTDSDSKLDSSGCEDDLCEGNFIEDDLELSGSQSPLQPLSATVSLVVDESNSCSSHACSSVVVGVGDSLITDIGHLLSNGLILSTLSDTHKSDILKFTPDMNGTYPTTYMNGCNRKFKPQWLKSHP